MSKEPEPTLKHLHPHYHLRYQILPGAQVAEDARQLTEFCRAHGIEEVVLFFAGEEWNDGLLSAESEDRWFEAVRQAKEILEAGGITTSLNPWMTVLHCARGRGFPPDRPFRPAVSPLGEVSQATASFADPAWQEYIYRLYGRFAQLGFRAVWVEDDLRYHNHEPLTWGAGFEPEVLARFARLVGRPVTREEVVACILAPGKPHPWRGLWMQTWRELHLEVASGITAAVARQAPGVTTVGLMSSHPAVHSVEGRDWQRMLGALSIDGRVEHRPHFAGYAEDVGANLHSSIIMLDLQKTLRPAGCAVAPEVENFPYTCWTKSDRLTWAQMGLCLFQGADALQLNLYPFTGNRPGDEPEVGALLDRSRPALRWIGEAGFKDMAAGGIGIPWRQDAQAHVRTGHGHSLRELDATFHDAAHLLLTYGVPVTAAQPQRLNAVFGNLMWAFNAAEIEALLAGGLLLDGVSAAILCERGFGLHLGLEFGGWAEREESDYAVETVTAGAPGGGRPGVHLSVNLTSRMARMTPLPGAAEWTTVVTCKGERFGAGWVAFTNTLGGRVVTCAAPAPAHLCRSFHRQAIVQAAVRYLGGGVTPCPFVTGGPHLLPQYFRQAARQGARHVLVVLNGSPDAARPCVRVGSPVSAARATLLEPLKEACPARVLTARAGSDWTLQAETEVPHLGFMVFEWD